MTALDLGLRGGSAGFAAIARGGSDARRTLRVVLGLARFTMLEAWRGRWPIAAVLLAAAVALVQGFTAATALTESSAVALSLAAPLARLAAVLVVAIFAIGALVRELNDGSIDLALAAPVSRLTWLAGRWLGLAGIALGTAIAAAAPLAANAPWLALAAWTASLALELVLVCGVGLLLSISFAQLPAALLSLLAFYTMSRLVGIVMLINARAPLEGPALLARVGDAVLGALGHLLPRLDLFTRTDWLLGASGAAAGTGLALLQVTIWLVLVPAVGWLDFRNRRG
jgi:ABC-type transport system involved in multi-copper enzyme maturation permease subunit